MPIRQDPGLTFAVTATDKCSTEFKVDIPQLRLSLVLTSE